MLTSTLYREDRKSEEIRIGKTTARYLRKTSRGVGRRVSRIVTW